MTSQFTEEKRRAFSFDFKEESEVLAVERCSLCSISSVMLI